MLRSLLLTLLLYSTSGLAGDALSQPGSLPSVSAPHAPATPTPAALAAQLEQAARTGQAEAYLQLLTAQGTFVQESRAFAADLAQHPQPSVTYRLDELEATGPATARARLTLRWERSSLTGSQKVTLPVELQLEREGWRLAGESFQTLAGGRDQIQILRGAASTEHLRPLSSWLEEGSKQVGERLGLEVPRPLTLKVYPDSRTLSATVALSLKPVGGWHEPREAIKLLLRDWETAQAAQQTRFALVHELTHVAVIAEVGTEHKARIPWWLHEGLADYAAAPLGFLEDLEARTRRVLVDWVPLAQLADFAEVPEERWKNSYGQGYGVVSFLATQQAESPMKLARAFATGHDADHAAQAVGFVDFAELEAAARTWLSND